MYVIVWEFVARPGREADFERAYGPRGRWVELFRGGEGYLGSELWRGEGRWLTVDRWESEEDFLRFRGARLAEYQALDREMEELTASERQLGAFTSL
ncbi:MAG TPA: antibiotic biosynthesis monooxygenase [Myxococcales bacterium]|nr:antibiotic biosynthesis monooxygenase [Myxococcales bacterium]